MAEQKVNKDPARDVYLWNFWTTAILVRVRADKFVVTDSYVKEIKDYYQKESKSGSGGLTVGSGDVSVGAKGSGSTSSESKTHDESEVKQKIEAFLNKANFQIINSGESSKFTLESTSTINYVSIIVDGVTHKNNWNVSDREVVVEANEANPNTVFISSNKTPTLQDYISKDKLFNVSFLERVKSTLSSFKSLYDFGKTATVDDKRVISNATIEEIARMALDFRGVNISVANLISAVSDVFFNQSLTTLYNHIYQTDLSKLDKDFVKAQLFNIGKQAKDIGKAFDKAGSWYFQLAAEINKAHDDIILNEAASQKELADKITDITKKKNDAYSNYCDTCEEMKWKIPLSWLNPISGSVVTAHLVTKRDGYYDDYTNYNNQLQDLIKTQGKSTAIYAKITKLAEAVILIGTFCTFLSSWFKQKSNAYSNFGKKKADQSEAISDKWKNWTTDECISWALQLTAGYYKTKYEAQIRSAFKDEKITGEDLPDLGVRFFKKTVGIEEHDATQLIGEINLLAKSSAISYQGFKDNYKVDMKWIENNKADLDLMSKNLIEINTQFVFLEKGVDPSPGWGAIALPSFGKDFEYSPEKEAKSLLQN